VAVELHRQPVVEVLHTQLVVVDMVDTVFHTLLEVVVVVGIVDMVVALVEFVVAVVVEEPGLQIEEVVVQLFIKLIT
jgi:hypothetical protein